MELDMGLTKEQHAARKIGGSDAAVVIHGIHFDKTVHQLWLEKTGQAEPENLDDSLRVQMGTFTEALNVLWYEKQTGHKVTVDPKTYVHGVYDFATCHLDGLTNARKTKGQNIDPSPLGVFEAKHTNAWQKEEAATALYYPQLQHNMAVTERSYAHLSVFYGNDKWTCVEVQRDDSYIELLMEREAAFWFAVESMTEPVDTLPMGMDGKVARRAKPPIKKEIDMSGSNEWGEYADKWLVGRVLATEFKETVESLKALVEPDVTRAYGNGVQVTRDGRGVSVGVIKERKKK